MIVKTSLIIQSNFIIQFTTVVPEIIITGSNRTFLFHLPIGEALLSDHWIINRSISIYNRIRIIIFPIIADNTIF